MILHRRGYSGVDITTSKELKLHSIPFSLQYYRMNLCLHLYFYAWTVKTSGGVGKGGHEAKDGCVNQQKNGHKPDADYIRDY